MKFQALLLQKNESEISCDLVTLEDQDLMQGDVTVRVEYSSINYKDGLALTGKIPVVRKYPLIPGIDFAGTVLESSNSEFSVGDRVLLNGWGVGEAHHGGFSEIARVPGKWLTRIPSSLSARECMALGTAGYTAMLSVLALQSRGVEPKDGPILVTGASGGVGSVSIGLLSSLGYTVWASTGKLAEADYLCSLGAAEVIERAALSRPGKQLDKEKWAGVVDSVGSHTLVNAIAQTRYGGTVTACGLAQGLDLPGSVAPFILRGVSLLGIDSVNQPASRRDEAWGALEKLVDRQKLMQTVTEVSLAEVPGVAARIVQGHVRGRTVVNIPA